MPLKYYGYPAEKVSSACSDIMNADGSLQDRLWAGYSQLARLQDDNFPPRGEALKRFRLVKEAMLNHKKLTDQEVRNAIDNLLVLRSDVEEGFTELAHLGKMVSAVYEQDEVFGKPERRPQGLSDKLDGLGPSDDPNDLAALADSLDALATEATGKLHEYFLMVSRTAREWSSEPVTWGRYGWLNDHITILQIASFFQDAKTRS